MSLSLYFLFCIWGFGTVALMGNKSCYSTSLNFPPGHLKANMGKVFLGYHFLILRRIHSCFESDNCFQMGTRVNLGKARPVHTNLWTISLSLNFLFNFDHNFYFQFSFFLVFILFFNRFLFLNMLFVLQLLNFHFQNS